MTVKVIINGLFTGKTPRSFIIKPTHLLIPLDGEGGSQPSEDVNSRYTNAEWSFEVELLSYGSFYFWSTYLHFIFYI